MDFTGRLKQNDERNRTISLKIHSIAKFLPELVKVMEFIKKLSQHMSQDEHTPKLMEKVTEPEVSCKDSFEAVNVILKKLGAQIMTNLYYGTVKQLIERISNVMVDREAIQLLVKVVKVALYEGQVVEELGLNPDNAGERGLRLLFVLSFVFPSHFLYKDVIKKLLSMLGHIQDQVAPLVLSILTFIGEHQPISELFPDMQDILERICLQFISLGTSKQVFSKVLDEIKEKLNGDKDKHFLTAIVALGYFSFHLPEKFPVQLKNLVSRKIVKELVMKDVTAARGGEDTWCSLRTCALKPSARLKARK